jgi:hypothetical protein
MLRELLEAARGRTTLTYGRLMKNYHLSRGRCLSRAISEIDRAEGAKGAPGFAAIIVRKDTGYPGGGYFCHPELPVALRRAASRSTDPKLSASEKEYVRQRQERIWKHYSRKGPAAVVSTT